MICPLCRQRKARRGCPALGDQICAVCCGTKRLVEIRCPSDCGYLTSSREHPPAVVVRQQQRDVAALVEIVKDFDDRQSQLFFVAATCLIGYQPPELGAVSDADVADAARALAATFETASRGVIYEHRPASIPAERLGSALRAALRDAVKNGGSAFERDAAVVLRQIADACDRLRVPGDGASRALLDLLGRVMRKVGDGEAAEPAPPDRGRLILP